MDIELGWCLDAASWTDAGGALGAARVGPRALTRLLQTRLGLGRPAVEPAVRIAQYAALVERADHPWPRTSARLDPWATARHLLALRDELVLGGWDGAPPPGDGPVRLAALAAIERGVVLSPAPGATLGPGPADDLAEIRDLLAELAAGDAAWPLGIGTITCAEDPSALPGLWTDVLALLGCLGVDVRTAETASATPGPRLRLVTAPDEWAAAEAAARFLAERGDGSRVLATADTIVLDQELRRRALPALGVAPASADRAAQQVLALFVAVAIAPVDVRLLAALLDLRLLDAPAASAAASGSAGGERTVPRLVEPTGLVPARVRRTLLRALADEPGIGGPAWEAALAALHDGTAPEREAAAAIDELVRDPLPADAVRPQALRARTDWLVSRLRAVARGSAGLAASTAQVTAFREVLALLPDRGLGQRDLQQIIASCGTAAPSPLGRSEAASWRATTDPAHVRARGGTLLWWGCIEPEPHRRTVWDAVERSAMSALGVRCPEPEAFADLETSAALRGLGTASEIIAIRPARRGGEPTLPHALVSHLVVPSDGEQAAGAPATVQEALERASVRAEDLVEGGAWRLAGAERSLRRPDPTRPVPREDLTRTVRSAHHGARLVPERLSFSQVENLIGCHQKWVYRSALGIRPASVATVATGNRMIGTLVHAAVEALVAERQAEGATGAPRPEQIRAAIDALLPRFASELLLPGREAERAQLYETVTRSLRTFFERMADAGFVIRGTERRFERDLVLPLAAGERVIRFSGFRDVDAEAADGAPVVIDLKWTFDRSRYGRAFDAGEALQLAAYAWSVEPHGAAAARTAPARVGYFLLKQGEFVAADEALDRSRRPEPDVRDTMGRMARELTHAFDEMADGTVTAVSGQVRLRHELGLHPARADLEAATSPVKAEARDRGGIWIDAKCGYCDFSLLCGLRGDFS